MEEANSDWYKKPNIYEDKRTTILCTDNEAPQVHKRCKIPSQWKTAIIARRSLRS